jgi:hypothetical protein
VTVQESRPPDLARVLIRVAPWTNQWHPAIARYSSEGTLRWRTQTAGWIDAHPNDEWVESRMTEAGLE